MLGKRISTLAQLRSAALNKRSVVSPRHQGLRAPKPAAFVLNWQGERIYYVLINGLYVYEKENRPTLPEGLKTKKEDTDSE